MASNPVLTKCEARGVVCNRCQESVNVHACMKCKIYFFDQDEIYCESQGQFDSNHYHKRCWEKS